MIDILEFLGNEILVGIMLGLICQGKWYTLVLASGGAAFAMAAYFGNWSHLKGLFANFDSFVWIVLNDVGFFTLLIPPVILASIGTHFLRKKCCK